MLEIPKIKLLVLIWTTKYLTEIRLRVKEGCGSSLFAYGTLRYEYFYAYSNDVFLGVLTRFLFLVFLYDQFNT